MTVKRGKTDSRGWFFGLSSQAIWGTGGATIKSIDAALPSGLLVSMRHGIGALVLGSSLLTRKRHLLQNAPLFHLIALGILAAGLPDLLLVESVRRSGAIVGVMLARLEIPLGVIFAHWLLKERVGASAYVACLISLGGASLISFGSGEKIELGSDFFVGVLLGIAVAILWGLSSVYGKYILNRKTDPLALSFVRLAVGSIFNLALVLILVRHPFQALPDLRLIDWGLVLYLGIFLSGLAYLLFYKALHILDAHVVSILISAAIVVILLSGLIIGEQIRPVQWLGIGMIIASLLIIKRKPKPVEEPLDAD